MAQQRIVLCIPDFSLFAGLSLKNLLWVYHDISDRAAQTADRQTAVAAAAAAATGPSSPTRPIWVVVELAREEVEAA